MVGVISAWTPQSYTALGASMAAPSVVQSGTYRNRLLVASTDNTEPDLKRFAQAFLRACQGYGWPMFVHTYNRSAVAQDKAFRSGRSRARYGDSPHNCGCAFDLVHFGRYWDLTPREWSLVGQVGKEVARKQNLKVTWGGDWKFYDPAHWELQDWKTRRLARLIREG